MKRALFVFLAVGLAACSGKSSDSDAGSTDAGPADAGPFIPGFNPGPAPQGYTRYITPVIDDITPGTDNLWCQWLSDTVATDQDVVDVSGFQSKYGHHVVLYATKLKAPVGTSRLCTTADMVSVTFLGAIGGEGTGGVASLPPGVVLRLHAGTQLMANTHFLNIGQDTVQGQAVVDVKTQAPGAGRVAGLFNNTAINPVNITPNGPFTLDNVCNVQGDLDFFLFANHMHQYGTSAVTTVKRADTGAVETMVEDDSWQSELQFNPHWSTWQLSAPFHLHAGDVMTTHCEWNNTTNAAITFPGEMCTGVGFFVDPDGGNAQDAYCVDNAWSIGSPP